MVILVGLLALSGPGLASAMTPQTDQTAAEIQALNQLVSQLNQELSAATEAYNYAKQQFEDTQAAVTHLFPTEHLGNVQLKGLSRKIAAYRIAIEKIDG